MKNYHMLFTGKKAGRPGPKIRTELPDRVSILYTCTANKGGIFELL
jgi:hypothetical protein